MLSAISLHALCRRHPLSVFCALAFAISWSYWLSLLGLGYRVEPGSSATHLPGLAGPFVAALIVTGLSSGRSGVRRLCLSCVTLPRPRLRTLALALSPLVLGGAVFAVLAALGQASPAYASFKTYPGAPQNWPLPAIALLALLLNGIGEEGGWRGFALAQLAARRSRLAAALGVAGLWMLWHAPLFALNQSMAALLGPTLLGWAVGLSAGAVVLAWLYFATRSVLVVALWHTSFNFMVATMPGRGLVAAVLSTVVMILAVVCIMMWAQAPAPSSGG